jgi:hypothetical protein
MATIREAATARPRIRSQAARVMEAVWVLPSPVLFPQRFESADGKDAQRNPVHECATAA